MPTRLLREPHLLAHELRTPLSGLAGWYSLIATGDVRPGTVEGERGLAVCQEAIDRLNFVIDQASDEASALRERHSMERVERLARETKQAIDHSYETLLRVSKGQTTRLASITRMSEPPPGPAES